MRDYGKVYSTFWSSANIQALSDDGKVLALYLMTCQHNTISGVFRLPDGYASEDLKWSAARVWKGLYELFDNGFANRCETTKWVWVIKHFEWNTPENPNQIKAAKKCAQLIPAECTWKSEFMRVHGEYLGFDPEEIKEPLANPSETLPKPEAVTGAVTETTTELKPMSVKPDVSMDLIREIFSHWQTVMSTPTSKLDAAREGFIRKGLKLDFTPDQLKLAIDGCSRTDHNMGKNDRNTKYNGLSIIFKNAENIERFINATKGGGNEQTGQGGNGNQRPDNSAAGQVRAAVARRQAERAADSGAGGMGLADHGIDVWPPVGEQLRSGAGPGQSVGVLLEGAYERSD